MRSKVLLLIALAAVTGCFAEAPIKGAQCNKERPCPLDYFCQGAQCHEGSPYVQSLLCTEDPDCRAGAFCHPTDGLCVQCHSAEHCLTGLCTSEGTCTTCSSHDQCPVTGRCNTYGYCAACLVDGDCSPGVACLTGLGQCDAAEEDRREDIQSVTEERPEEGS